MSEISWRVVLDQDLIVKEAGNLAESGCDYIGSDFFATLNNIGFPWDTLALSKKDFNGTFPFINNSIQEDGAGRLGLVNLVISPMTYARQAQKEWCVHGSYYSFSHRCPPWVSGLQAWRVLTYMPGYIYWKNKSSVYLGCNENFAKAAGLNKAQDIVGKTDYDLAWARTEAELFRDGDRKVLEDGELVNFEEPQMQSDGKEVIVLATKAPLLDEDNKQCGVVGIYTDISKRKEQERLLEKAVENARLANQSKSDFIANMGHDVRTPLSGIIGLADNLYKSLDADHTKQMAHDIYMAGNQLMSLCNEILEVAEIDSGLLEDNRSSFKLKDFIDNVCFLMMPAAKHKQLLLDVIYEGDMAGHFLGCRTLLHRVLANLLSNAIKFTDRGGVTVRASISEKGDDGAVIFNCSIIDTGVGIPVSSQNRVFECFNRGVSSYQSSYEGTGLGLYIVRKFIIQMNGEISLMSKVGSGSCFSFSIPIDRTTPACSFQNGVGVDHIDSGEDLKSKMLRSVQNMRVLLVEDDPLSQKVGTIVIGQLGCKLDIASNGAEAIALFKKNKYACVFLDIGLPDIDGDKVMEKMRAESAASNHSCFISALTAHVSRRDEPELVRRGFDRVLRKPITQHAALMACCGFLHGGGKVKMLNKTNLELSDDGSVAKVDVDTSFVGMDRYDHCDKSMLPVENDLYQMLIEDLSVQWPRINASYQEQDYQQLSSQIHRLRGGVSYVDVPSLRDVVGQLDAVLLNKNYQNIESKFSSLKQVVEHLLAD